MHLKRRCLQPSQTGLHIRRGECSKPNSTERVKRNGTALPPIGARHYPAHNTEVFHHLSAVRHTREADRDYSLSPLLI